MSKPHVVIIGGGITGLSAAWHLQASEAAEYTLLEQANRWGGKIITERIDADGGGQFIVEYVLDLFVAQKPQAKQLAQAVGMGDEIIGTNLEKRRIYLLNRRKLTPLPDGMMLIIPTRFMPFATSSLISIPGKIRMALEPFIPAWKGDGDESIDDFVRRRLGQEAVDKLAEPLLSGIFNTDPERQSLLFTFPRFRALEQKYGSLTRGILQARKHMPKGKTSPFQTMKGGMSDLVDAVLMDLTGDLRLNTSVAHIERGAENGYTLTLASGEIINADAVIFATPAKVTAQLMQTIQPEAAGIIRSIPLVSTGTLTLGYRNEDLPRPLDGHGVVIPRKAQRSINAITWSSSKFDYRAPEGYSLMRVFFGGSRSPQTMELDDELRLHETVFAELRDIMQIEKPPVFTRVYRLWEAIPQYVLGHQEQLAQLEALMPEGVQVAGSAYRGSGVPDCIQSAKTAVEKIVEMLQTGEPEVVRE